MLKKQQQLYTGTQSIVDVDAGSLKEKGNIRQSEYCSLV